MINRRSFLTSLLAGAVLDLERILWKPGQKKIFIPPPPREYYKIEWPVSAREWTFGVYVKECLDLVEKDPRHYFLTGTMNEKLQYPNGRTMKELLNANRRV